MIAKIIVNNQLIRWATIADTIIGDYWEQTTLLIKTL